MRPTPLPRRQLAILCTVVLAEPLQTCVIFPFIYFMVRDFHVVDDEEQIGYYVGLIAASFSLAQFATSFFWGWLSDKIGRRPVLLAGLLGGSAFGALFGFSKSVWFAVVSRTMCGVLSGNIGVAKSLLGEITDDTNRAEGFSIIGLTWAMGTIAGPILGGFLADPTEKYPWLFPKGGLFEAFPYLLPCLASSMFGVCGFVLGFFTLKEPMPRSIALQDSDNDEDNADIENQPLLTQEQADEEIDIECADDKSQDDAASETKDNQEATPPPSNNNNNNTKDWLTREACLTIAGYGLLAFTTIIFEECFPLYAASPVKIGGLGFDTSDIGVSLSAMGVIQIVLQLGVYPWVERSIGVLACYRASMLAYIPIFLAFPFVNLLAAANVDRTLFWAVLVTLMGLKWSTNTFAYTSVMILVNNSATDSSSLGKIHGVAQTVAALVRGIGPALGGALWSWSVSNGLSWPFNCNFVYNAIAVVNLFAWLESLLL